MGAEEEDSRLFVVAKGGGWEGVKGSWGGKVELICGYDAMEALYTLAPPLTSRAPFPPTHLTFALSKHTSEDTMGMLLPADTNVSW